MDPWEKQMVIIAVILVCLMAGSVTLCSIAIESGGGMKQIIIDAGKDIKDISREIEKN